ncbi:iron ABC transporter permease [Pelistega sp. NLN82]|uniref:Iron ABC transporter permease n=1 Tax=Pelistega ratti TaxID=2652177 RepID=A0A6L9Y4G7_9BURK|nr:iron ABC transporter permease [Pelistega ratti]
MIQTFKYKITFILITSIILLLCAIWVISIGTVNTPLNNLPYLLFGDIANTEQTLRNLLLNIRIPRVLLAMVAGAVTAVAGVIMQALFRNPLAEPGLMGISSGASLGAVTAIVLLGSGFIMITTFAFTGSLVATLFAYLIGKRFGHSAGLLLAGIAINAISFSIIGLFTYMANDHQLRDLTFWSMGSLATSSWTILLFLIPWSFILLSILSFQWRSLNALLLGEREVIHLGFNIKNLRRHLILSVALLVGPLVAITGGINFIGLVVPHIMRMILGANHKYLIPASMFGGALLLLGADTLARTLISPAELPVGLLTSLIGGPFFLYLLLSHKQNN